MADLCSELVEVPPLDGLQSVGNAVLRRVPGRIVPDTFSLKSKTTPIF